MKNTKIKKIFKEINTFFFSNVVFTQNTCFIFLKINI
jgi:hypothetical protein